MLSDVIGGLSIDWDSTARPQPPLWDRSGTHAALLAGRFPVYPLAAGANPTPGLAGMDAAGAVGEGAAADDDRCAVQ